MNAIRLLGAIPSLNQNLHMFFWVRWWSDVYEQVIARVREMATDETWEKAFAEGGTLSMQQAMAIALQELQRQSLRGLTVLRLLEGKENRGSHMLRSHQVDIYLMRSIIRQFDSLEESHEYICFTSAGERSSYCHKN